MLAMERKGDEAFCEGPPPLIAELSYTPRAGIVGSYGGGDAMQMARQLWLQQRSADLIPAALKQTIQACIVEALHKHAQIPKSKRIAHLPEIAPDLKNLKWTFHVQMSSHVYGESSFNMMYQGLLYADICKDPERKGERS